MSEQFHGKRNHDMMGWDGVGFGIDENDLELFGYPSVANRDDLMQDDVFPASGFDEEEDDGEVPCSARTSISSAATCLSSAPAAETDWTDVQCPPPPPMHMHANEAVCVQGSPMSSWKDNNDEMNKCSVPFAPQYAYAPVAAPNANAFVDFNHASSMAAYAAAAAAFTVPASAPAPVPVPMPAVVARPPVAPMPVPMVAPPAPAVAQQGRFVLRADTKVHQVWYVDRPFPAFDVTLVDTATGQPVTDLAGWKVSIAVLDGFGDEAWDKVYGQVHNHQYPLWSDELQTATATIAGLRFRSVSSKAGGHFRVVTKVTCPDAAAGLVAPLVSEPIQVLSYRLYHAPKVSFDKLKATDSISKMKGIGALYAKRFANVGVKTVHDLASIDLLQLGDEGTKRLLLALRKDRGAMTIDKLESYIHQARDILLRSPVQEAVSSPVMPASPPSVQEAPRASRRIKIGGVDVSALSLFSQAQAQAQAPSMAPQPFMCFVRVV